VFREIQHARGKPIRFSLFDKNPALSSRNGMKWESFKHFRVALSNLIALYKQYSSFPFDGRRSHTSQYILHLYPSLSIYIHSYPSISNPAEEPEPRSMESWKRTSSIGIITLRHQE
jgi:hypothetical protein